MVEIACAIDSEGCTGAAFALAPQDTDPSLPGQGFEFQGHRFVYLPVCAGHLDGWLDGTDDHPFPPIFGIEDASVIANAFVSPDNGRVGWIKYEPNTPVEKALSETANAVTRRIQLAYDKGDSAAFGTLARFASVQLDALDGPARDAVIKLRLG